MPHRLRCFSLCIQVEHYTHQKTHGILVHYKISYSWPLRELMDVHVAFLPRMFSAD